MSLGEATLSVVSDVQVSQKNVESGWKQGIAWHRLCLVPLPASSPAVEQGWALAGADDGGGGDAGGNRAKNSDKCHCVTM